MKQWLDRITGRITMYRLVLLCLLVIAAAALTLSIIGELSASPAELLTSLAVALVSSLAASWLFARLFRTTAHLESALITGMLLFFLFRPSLAVADLGALALAGAIAGASKYVLAVRGRHLFNPAAIGALLVALTQLGFASWWVATPWLLPFTAVGAFLVLYRTRRLLLGTGFAALALGIVTVRLVLAGQDLGAALSTGLLSYPIVFFAGFMLSEPLTLPPRAWQRAVEVVLVALLFAVPFSLGPLYNSPELALVVGNLLAFAFGQRRGIRLEYLGKTALTPRSWELSFRPARVVRFVPGQFMELTIPHRRADFRGSRRMFSISSAPSTDAPITFAITVPEKSSSFKHALLELEPGTLVHGTTVGGDFTLPSDLRKPVLLVAGGIGITPFASQLADAHARGQNRDVVVVYVVSSASDLAYSELLERAGVRVVVVAPEPPDSLPARWEYAGQAPVDAELLERVVPDVAQRYSYVSGPPGLVDDVRGTLRSLKAKRVTTDYFAGY